MLLDCETRSVKAERNISYLLRKYRERDGRQQFINKKMKDPYSIQAQQKLRNTFLKIKTTEELASVLRISLPKLSYLAIDPKYFNWYRFDKKKKRVMNTPNGDLKKVQARLNTFLQAVYSEILPDNVHGFVKCPDEMGKKRSIKSNAAVHCGKDFVVNMDIKQFFQSINAKLVRKTFLGEPFNFNLDVASAIALICIYKYTLPMGSPASPIVSNLVFHPLDLKIIELANTEGYEYTRYADDLTFSGDHRPDFLFLDAIAQELDTIGLKLNQRKFRVCSKYSTQRVTGLKVNEKVNVDRKYIRLLRAIQHDIEMNGKIYAAKRYLKKEYLEESDLNYFEKSMQGKLLFVKEMKK